MDLKKDQPGQSIRIAVLDLYDGTPNQGMRSILDIVEDFEEIDEYKVFDVRGKKEVPDLSYDIYISSGGPGSPHDVEDWGSAYYEWLQSVWDHNLHAANRKKYVFFICHSFQLACIFFKIGSVIKRKGKSFGVFPVHKTGAGQYEILFRALPDPFYIADFRDYQVIEPDIERIETIGAKILALEKIRPHVQLERAIMAIRFSDEIFGVQFHPEADPEGMLVHFSKSPFKEELIGHKGEEKYGDMIVTLNDPEKLALTHDAVLPGFIRFTIESLNH